MYALASALVISLGLLIGAAPAEAQGARALLERRHDEVNRILRQPAANEAARERRSGRLRELLSGLLDFPALSERALGDHWEGRSESERERFIGLLQRLVERNYENNLERILDFEVSYDEERRRGPDTMVTTTARSRTQRRQPPVEIEYTLHRANGEWRVVDVATDGVSMVQNYRSQFHRIITRDGWDALIERMERRLADGGE